MAPDDGARTLTLEGRRGVRRVGEALARTGARPARMLASPLPRAVQTAELIAAALAFDFAIETHARLMPATPAVLAKPIVLGETDDVALVAHEPLLGALAGMLLGRTHPPLAKAQVVCIEIAGAPPGRLVWTLDPKTLELRVG